MAEQLDSSSDEAWHNQEIVKAKKFVNEALFPFLIRCKSLKEPTVAEIGALIWGYQTATNTPVSPFYVGIVLRQEIRDMSQSGAHKMPSLKDLVTALQFTHEIIPKVAAHFSYKKIE